MRNKKIKWIIWAVLLVILLLYPRFAGIYYTNVLVGMLIFALYGISLNLLLGYTGLLSFGHAMYFGTGGYATALSLEHIEGLPILVALLIGFAAALLLALIMAPLVVRVSGTAFAMLHMAFGLLMYTIVLKLRFITYGEDGVGGFPIPSLFGIDMLDPINFYYFAMAVLLFSIWILWFFTKTPFGQIIVGIRDKAMRIDYLGFKVPQTKAVVYCFAGAFAGIAGSIYALFQNLISPDGALHILASFTPIIITIIGGLSSFFGPLFGAIIFALIDEITHRFTERVELVVGMILIVVILFYPMGFIGFIHFVKGKWMEFWLTRKANVEVGS